MLLNQEIVFSTFGERKWIKIFKVLWDLLPKIFGRKRDHSFASICLNSKFVQILFGNIPSIVMMYIIGVLEEMVKDFWQDTFVSCICKFESVQPIYIIYC